MQHLKKVLRPNFQGTTLIELCCVISLIGFVAFFCLRSYHGHELLVKAELDRIYAFIIYVRRKAMLERYTMRVQFHQTSYTFDTLTYLAPHVQFAFPRKSKGPPSHPHQTITKAITFKNNVLEGYADGTISSGALYLTDDTKSCLYALTTDASAITGLRRYRYLFSSGIWESAD